MHKRLLGFLLCTRVEWIRGMFVMTPGIWKSWKLRKTANWMTNITWQEVEYFVSCHCNNLVLWHDTETNVRSELWLLCNSQHLPLSWEIIITNPQAFSNKTTSQEMLDEAWKQFDIRREMCLLRKIIDFFQFLEMVFHPNAHYHMLQ